MMQTVIVQLALQIVIRRIALRLGLGLLVPNEVLTTPMLACVTNPAPHNDAITTSPFATLDLISGGRM